MQPKFTRRSLVYFFSRLSMLTLVMALTTLIATAQKTGRKVNHQVNADLKARTEQKMNIEKFGRTPVRVTPSSDNDAGLPNKNAGRVSAANAPSFTEAVCATFTGSLGAGDATMPTRLFRGGVNLSSCAANPAFPATSAVSPFVDIHTWTNTSGLTQCATIVLTTTDLTNANIQHGVWNGTFVPANMATNYLSDPGTSTGTPAAAAGITISVTVNAGQTIVIPVWSANASTGGATGTASNYTVTVNLPICASAPCAATPTPGNTLSTVTTVCPGINFTLSLQNATTGSGVTYQWQSAATMAGTYTNITGATGSTLTTTQAAAACYRCVVTCAGNGSGTSTPVCVALTPPTGCYCTPGASDCSDDDVILRVRLSTLDNASTCGTGPPAGYTNYTTTVAAPIVYAGAANPITIDKPTTFSEAVQVWIDYNVNGTFEASELTTLNATANTLPSITANINIPATATIGVTRMRVRLRFAGLPGDPCLGYAFGETEDYNVNIQPCVPITITGSPANATIACGNSTSFTTTTTGSLPAYVWEYRVNASSPWQFVPAGAPYSGQNTATLTMTNVSQAFNGYQYRAVVVGGCSATDFSGFATLTVNAIVPTVTPPSATICVGTVQPLTLTNTLGNTDLISEGFNTMTPAGWTVINRSAPLGTTSWFQGDNTVFTSQSGAANAYAAANFNNTGAVGQISTWLITPSVTIKNGDILTFWTRKVAPDAFPDRMQVRMSGIASTNVGATATSVGDFTTLLADINPTEVTGVYPIVWTQRTITISGLAAPVTGNIAFRYFISNAGSAAANGDYIGVDNVVYTSTGGAAQGLWTGPAGTIFTNAGGTTAYVAGTPATTVYVAPTAAGVNNYQVNFTTPTPCTSSTTTVPVTVITPVVPGTNPLNRTVCVGGSTTFTTSATGGPVTYQWQRSVDGGLTYTNIGGATSATLTLTGIAQTDNGNRYRAVISAAPCVGSVTTTAATLTVNALPVVTLTSSDLQLTPGQITSVVASSTPAAAAGGWSWTLNGAAIAGNTSNTVSNIGIDEIGTYRATVTDVNGCSASSANLVIGAEASDRLWIYPNPNDGVFQVRLYYDPSTISEKRAVYIYNAAGQVVATRELDLTNTTAAYVRMDFNMGSLAAGTYVVKVVHKYTGKIKSGLVIVQ